ncbi:MAG TPA: ABC transporter ATP-binding protein [Casimicrobiaceae bacterium]|nr:ABC transporter ATP-binding protein [Casimicrobiaceae bacterium]
MTTPAKLEIRELSISFAAKPRVHAVDAVSLTVAAGETLCLLGPSGCGKSSVLRAVAGFVQPDSGHIRVDGRLVTAPGADRGMVFQEYALFPWHTVSRNIAFGLRRRIPDAAKREAAVRSWIAKVKLEGFEKAYPKQLSGGMRQRVAIARALAPEPQVLLMDEPFGALDAQTRVLMQEMLEGLIAESRNAVVFVTHDIDEALIVGDTLCVMSRRPGRVLETLRNPFARPRSAHIFEHRDYGPVKARIFEMIRRQID